MYKGKIVDDKDQLPLLSDRKTNSNTGVLGVSRTQHGRYCAYITLIGGRQKCLGTYSTLPEAAAARAGAERVLLDRLTDQLPDGYVCAKDYSAWHQKSIYATLYHIKHGHFPTAIQIGGKWYLPLDDAWPVGKQKVIKYDR